jgi:hypothetical protein
MEKLSQPAVIVLFAPMLMHLLQYILFLSLSYVNHVYKLAQRDWNFPCSLFSLASCTRFIASRIAQNCLNCWKSFLGRRAPIPRPNGPLFFLMMDRRPINFKSYGMFSYFNCLTVWELCCFKAYQLSWRAFSSSYSHYNCYSPDRRV